MYGRRKLLPEIQKQILSGKGEFIHVRESRHVVAFAQKQGRLIKHGLYFKLYPAFPGMAYLNARTLQLQQA